MKKLIILLTITTVTNVGCYKYKIINNKKVEELSTATNQLNGLYKNYDTSTVANKIDLWQMLTKK